MSNESTVQFRVGSNFGNDLSAKPPGPGRVDQLAVQLPHDYAQDARNLGMAGSGEVIAAMRSLNLSRVPRVTFPLPNFPIETGWRHSRNLRDQRQFGGPRWNDRTDPVTHKTKKVRDRLHAGVDLEAPIGTQVLAMADGIVLRIAEFYSDTWEVSVLHPGIGIVRYGEVNRATIGGYCHEHSCVEQGQPIADVGQRIENHIRNKRAMLHLELYRDETRLGEIQKHEKNALSQGKGTEKHPSFERRSDMEDPTGLVEEAPLYKRPAFRWPEFVTLDHQVLVSTDMNPSSGDALQTLLQHAQLFDGSNV